MSAPCDDFGLCFTDAELDQVEDDLIRILEDTSWKREQQYLRPSSLRRKLYERGHTLARIEAMCSRLIERGAFEACSHTVENTVDAEPVKYRTTRARWFEYVAARKAQDPRQGKPEPNNPYRKLLNFARQAHEGELGRCASLASERRQSPTEWGPHVQAREAELHTLVDACLAAAEQTGFGVGEVERRVNALASAAGGILLWQRDAPRLSREEREKMEQAGTWEDPAGDYISHHYRQMMAAWQSVHALAVRAESHRKGEGSDPVIMPPPALPTVGLFAFDLRAICRCAVELGAAIAGQPDGVANREVEIAGERLKSVLNPRDATFPYDSEWNQFQALREIGAAWTRGKEPLPGWRQELDRADASLAARQALLTLGLALADLRGDPRWHDRGRELLGAGAWNLWDGMCPADRKAVRALLKTTHRLWGWPEKPNGKPAPFAGQTADLTEYRILWPSWRTVTTADLQDSVREIMQTANYLVDHIGLADGARFPYYRYDCRPSAASLPTICPNADPKPPVELRPEGDMLAEIETSYRSLRLVGDDQSIHWVGRQATPKSTCTCHLDGPPAAARPDEWKTLRQLRRSIVALMELAQDWAGRQIPAEPLRQLDRLGEQVVGLTQALGLKLPKFPQFPLDQGFRLRGPAHVPTYLLDEGVILVASQANVERWASEWRAIRVAVDTRLDNMDSPPRPGPNLSELQVDTRDDPLEAPAGTPSPLREAFDAVADAVFHAAEFRRCAPTAGPVFDAQADTLQKAWRAARDRYAAAETLLRAVTDASEPCPHQEALSVAKRINDAVGHVLLGSVPAHQATAHILAQPIFNLGKLLQAMRWQTSRATVQLQTVNVRSAREEGAQKSNGEERLTAKVPAASALTATDSGLNAQPDGSFGADGFRYRGVEVHFGRASKQRSLVLALWDGVNRRPSDPRPVEDVVTDVYGPENDTEDTAFRQLCADARRRFEGSAMPLRPYPNNP